MRVSVNPSYLCNFRCGFCYLGPALGDRTRISPEGLRRCLSEVSEYRPISGVDLYGGEVGLLDEAYFNVLLDVISEFYGGPVDVTTNLSKVPAFFGSGRITLAVSYDGRARERHEAVLRNMRSLTRPFRVLMLSTPGLIEQDPGEFISLFNALPNLESVEIKPYSRNQHNQLECDWLEQERWVQRWIESPIEKKFLFLNEVSIRECLSGVYNAYSDDHVYVTPQGGFAVLDFDSEDREYFRPVRDLSEYLDWCFEEKHKAAGNPYCGSCEFLGRCLTEHLRDVRSLERSCNGGFQILNWYRSRA